jgi:galactokinase/mevalonate kinase-like predicted kinase
MTFAASAPGRCGIVGNPSDIYGGNVLSCSLPVRATCRLSLGQDHVLPEDTRLWDAVTKRFPIEGPVRVEWTTGIPRSSGLSGSTAIVAATLAAVLSARGCPPELDTDDARTNFAELVRDIEINAAGIKGGYQDAYVIAHGGLRLMRFAAKHPVIPGPNGVAESLNAPLPFLLVTTGVERLSGSVHGPMIDRWLSGERLVMDSMERITQIGLEGAEALLSADYTRLGALMDENHRLVAALGGSGEAIDALIARCKHHGALGAKLAGAGLGGTVIALTEDAEALQAKLAEDGYSRFLRPEIQPGVRLEAV